jgi:hypothetical protein
VRDLAVPHILLADSGFSFGMNKGVREQSACNEVIVCLAMKGISANDIAAQFGSRDVVARTDEGIA